MQKDRKAEKERLKAEKAKKLAAKQAKRPVAASSKKTSAPAKSEMLDKYVEQTPKGMKKGLFPQNLSLGIALIRISSSRPS